MKKIEHIGIAVQNLEEAEQRFAKLLNTLSYKRETVESEGVVTSFFKVGDSKIELLAATNPNSPIQKFIDKKGEGIHHIAFEVADIEQQIKTLKASGFTFINEQAKDGADNKKIAFIHPKSTGGILVEICQEKTD
ncbi:MAG TPA: methylmalonyl-CoA epimerase [Flavobacteriales bacterium]|jgi:methylmalonyl-CoA/ethylmalonyl-CoA epimerase|nr:methylmalonyl-CoA epimerase [Flavobacteriales bacterium]